MSNNLSMLRPVFSALRPVLVYPWRVFEAFASITDKFWLVSGVLILLGMWGLLMLNCIARWTGWLPINWSLEITGFMVAWSVFVMMGPITRADENIRVSYLPEKVLGAKRGASFIHAFENLVGLFLCTYLTYHAYRLIIATKDLGLTQPSGGGWDYPMWIVRSCVFFGFCFAAVYYFERTVKWIIKLFTATGSEVTTEVDALTTHLASGYHTEEVRPETGTDK